MIDSTRDFTKGLNESQKAAVEQTDGPLLILAGAGSGKTKTIVHRIANLISLGVPPQKIIAVTFTNKAAKEMRDRTFSLVGDPAHGVLLRTFHALGLYLLRRYHKHLDYPPEFTIWDESDSRGVIEKILETNFPSINKFSKTEIRYFNNTIASWKDNLIRPEDVPDMIDLDLLEGGDIMVQLYEQYEQTKRKSIAFDFADLLYQTVLILERSERLLSDLHRIYHYFLVDEYQDTNKAQYTLIQLLSKKTRNLCVVGDDDQAIYGWRGADVQNILSFKADFPEAVIIKLEENYRSTQNILTLSNNVIRNNTQRMEKVLFSNLGDGELPLLRIFPDDETEARKTARAATALAKTIKPSEIVILYRTNAQSRLFEEALRREGQPYKIHGSTGFFDRREIKDLLAYISFLVNPYDRVAFFRIINTPSRGIGPKSVENILDYANSQNENFNFLEFLNADKSAAGLSDKASASMAEIYSWLKPVSDKIKNPVDMSLFFEDLLRKSGLKAMYKEEDKLMKTERIASIEELKNSMVQFQSDNPSGTVADYIQDISLFTSTTETGDDENSITLMTVHNSKGLEFDTVFLTGLEEDNFPHVLAKNSGSVDEERRLFYVAVTRAKKRLVLSRAERRMVFGIYRSQMPSRFLDEAGEKNYRVEGGTPTTYLERHDAAITESFRNTISSKIPRIQTDFKSGDKVKHPNFGTGKVLTLEGGGDAQKISIYFSDGKTRKFILRYTQLEKL